jgi:hypothetical protein
LPSVNQLSHQDKLRLIHVLLLAVAKEDGCNLETGAIGDPQQRLLAEMAATGGEIWSPQVDSASVQAFSDFIEAAKVSPFEGKVTLKPLKH